MTDFEMLIRWYERERGAPWDTQIGITLRSIDNSGWTMNVNLAGTSSAGRTQGPVGVERGDDDWLFHEAKRDVWSGACGEGNLDELIGEFVKFVEEHLYKGGAT